jgi:hypothetical protein
MPAATPAPAAKPAAAKPATTPAKPAPVAVEPEPTVAVLRANGKQHAVAVGEYFKLGDLWFRLVELAPKTMKVSIVGGSFTGGRQALTVDLGEPVTLFNTATGVEYTLGITKATSGIPTTSSAQPLAPAAAAPYGAAPSGGAPSAAAPSAPAASDPGVSGTAAPTQSATTTS